MKPQTFESAWAEAEAAVFDKLTAATKTEAGKSAHIGDPGIVNAWFFEWGAITDEKAHLLVADVGTLFIPATVSCKYQRRADAQAWAMRVVRALPLNMGDENNVVCLRVREVGALTSETVPLKNDQKTLVWTLDIGLDIVFETGGRVNGAD